MKYTFQQKLKNPNLRAAIPTSKLPARYKKARLANQRLDDPNAFSRPLTPRLAAREREAAVRLKFGDTEKQLGGERRSSLQQTQNIGDWFGQYQNQLKDIQGQQNAAYQQAFNQNRDMANTSAARDDQLRQELAGQMAKDAAMRGAPIDSSLDAQAQQASQARRAMVDVQGNQINTLGANQQAFTLGKQRVAGGDKVDRLIKEYNRRRNIEQDTRDLAGKKGDFRVDFMRDTRDKERQYGLERGAFGLKSEEAKLGAQTDQLNLKLKALQGRRQARSQARKDRLAGARLDLDTQKLGESMRHNKAMENKGGKNGGLSTAQVLARQKNAANFRDSIRRASADIKLITSKKKGIDGPTLRAVLMKQYKSADVVNSAMDLFYRKGLSPANRSRLKDRHVGVPKNWVDSYRNPDRPTGPGLTVGGR